MVTTRRAVTTSKAVSKPAVAVKASKAVSKPAVAVKASKKSRTEAPVARSGGGSWFEEVYSGAMSEEYKRYMREEWGMEKRGDVPLFEKLSLEGAQAGLSWATILAKREAYRAAFHGFDIKACAAMGDAEIDALCAASGSGADCIVKHRGKIASVANNALSGTASYFFLVSKPSNSCNQLFFRSRNKTKTGPDSLVLTSRPPSDAERRGHPIVVVQCNSSLLSRGRSCGQYVEASHRRNTWLTLFRTAGERRLRGTRAGQWTPPV